MQYLYKEVHEGTFFASPFKTLHIQILPSSKLHKRVKTMFFRLPYMRERLSKDNFLKTHQVRCLKKTSLPINNDHEQRLYGTKAIKLHEQVKTEIKAKHTNLVRKVKQKSMWMKPCGYCNGCRLFCGKCKNCLLMPLFGGKNKNKFACEQRPEKCENTEKYSKNNSLQEIENFT